MYSQYVSRAEYDRIVHEDYGDPDTFPHCNASTFHAPGGVCPYCDGYYLRHPDFAPASYATPEANGWGGNMAPTVDDEKAAEEEVAWKKAWDEMYAPLDEEPRPKQVIVIRRDVRMNVGKMCAMSAHASIAFLTSRLQRGEALRIDDLSFATRRWILDGFTKVVLAVDSEQELLEVHAEANRAGLEAFLISDATTIFQGIRTNAAVAIGPAFADEIDPITGHLKLL